MKTSNFIITLWVAVLASAIPTNLSRAQTAVSAPAVSSPTGQVTPQATPYAVIQRDANSRIWERTAYERAPNGKIVPRKHHYTELATGLCYQRNGQVPWLDAKEQIDILPDGMAAATQGQHQAYFPGDIAQGVIQLVTPDGKQLQSRPVGLFYDDGTNTVLFALLTNSVGQLAGSNQVIYANAFEGVLADLRYTYRKSGFEQDVILREQPPGPGQYGLNESSCRLELLTEFFDTNNPVQTAGPVNPQTGLSDATLTFGKITMTRGKAFSIGQDNPVQSRMKGVPTYKSWGRVNGRKFLVETVPYRGIAAQLEQLPAAVNAAVSANGILNKVSTQRLLPPANFSKSQIANRKPEMIRRLAKADVLPKPGVALDYVTVDLEPYYYTFQGDMTYYVCGDVWMEGTLAIEGGAIIKYAPGWWSGGGTIHLGDWPDGTDGVIICETAPDHPAIFTSMEDDSVGETIDGSSGWPSENDIDKFFSCESFYDVSLHDLRFSYSSCAIVWPNTSPYEINIDIWDCQFVNVVSAICGNNVGLHNVLINNAVGECQPAVYLEGTSLVAENLTLDGCNGLVEADSPGAAVAMTNCLITGTPIISPDSPYSPTLLTNATVCLVSPTAPVYQTGIGGNYYLPPDSPFIDAGNTTADRVGLYHYTTQTNQMVEGNSIVDLGYHYLAVDANGNPLDSNGDGIPDYLEDANGNGVTDGGESPWALAPTITVQPTNKTVVQGTNATFSVTAAGTAPLYYQWYFNTNTLIVGATSATLTLTNVQTTNAGFYRVTITNMQGGVVSSNAMLTVFVPPMITTQPANQTVVLGSDATFSVIATGTTPLSYQWYIDVTNSGILAGVDGATNATLILTNVQPYNAHSYFVVVTNLYGSVTSSNASLTVAVPMVAVGGERIMELTANGNVVSWGGNQYGELGDYTHLDSTNPVHVVGLTNITRIASGLNHSLVLDANGTLWAWGENSQGQLGNGGYEGNTNFPGRVLGMTNTIAIAAHGYNWSDGDFGFSLAVEADGTVWEWGAAEDYSFGGPSPVQMTGISNVVAVAAGAVDALALKNDGTVWAWGEDYNDTPGQVAGLSNIVAICAGDNHALALASNGVIWAWGYNFDGQLGDGGSENYSAVPVMVVGLTNVIGIAEGTWHSVAVDAQGNLWAWGDDSWGQLGDGGAIGSTNAPMLVPGMTNIVAAAAGSDATVAVDGNSDLWQWGQVDSYFYNTNFVWGDEGGFPTLAPTYVDYYNGQLPLMRILDGNNQTNYPGTEWPMDFLVADADGLALSNAPVSVEVVSGDMELRTASGGDNYKGLRLTTGANGEVSLIGYVDENPSDPNGLVRVLAASRERVRETNFNEALTTPPTISITSPEDGSTELVGINQGLPIIVAAQAGFDASIREVDYFYQTNGGDITPLGISSGGDFSFIWTNASWWSNDFVGQYTLSAVAVDNAGALSATQSVSVTVALDSYWFGIPDYLMDTNGTLAAWQTNYFGHIGLDPDSDPYGTGNSLMYDFQYGLAPNTISFSISFPNQYVATNTVTGVVTVWGGAPSSVAVLVDNTNFSSATWTAFSSSNVTVNLGSTEGPHDVWIGLVGSSLNAQPTWEETTLILDSTPPAISITNPADGSSFNASRVNVSGNFTAASLKQITVNDIIAFVSGTNFEALNVPLTPGSNCINAIVENFTGATNAASINIIGITNTDGSMNDPVPLQAAPVAGFAPLQVTFSIQLDAPGTFQQALYDFNGDGLTDFVTNNLNSLTCTYATNGEYFPVVTIQTTTGSFSSSGGWNSIDPNRLQINVQAALTQSTLASVTDPVDLKWDGAHLYVLSGSSGTITEFATNGTSVGSPLSLGAAASGFDVDAAGNVYVAVTASNQVWKFFPTNSSFQADTNFGNGGFIGDTNGMSGTTNGEFNAPFDVAVSPDGGTISVSDSGNNRIQQFSAVNGLFIAAFGTNGTDVGQFNAPKGLTYDASAILYVVDSGNNRIVMAQDDLVLGATGTGGMDLGQFSVPVNMNVGTRGVYVADTGNNRIQKFDLPSSGLFSIMPANTRFAVSTNFSQPYAVAAVNNFTNDLFYVADTGNNRVILCTAPNTEADAVLAVWNSMVTHVNASDMAGAASCFSSLAADKYRQAFLGLGAASAIAAINQVGTLTLDYVSGDEAEFYFEQVVDGQTITFPVEFVKENGVWKILEF